MHHIPLQFGKQGWRKPGMLTQIDQAHALAQPEPPQFVPNPVLLDSVVMVSDAIRKIVFLSVPVSVASFPFRKDIFYRFFTVKHIFPNIKSWTVDQPIANRPGALLSRRWAGVKLGMARLSDRFAEEKK